MAKETNQVLGHADEADGIEEYDNPLPDWWLGLFWFTIVFAVAYSVHYHFVGDRSQAGEFEAEMAAAEVRWPTDAEAGARFVMTEEAVAAGESIYQTNCVACHGMNLEGGIGPSFQDDEWIHGYSAQSAIRIITEGVAEKGMVAWGNILGAERINQVTAFILAQNAEYTGRSWEEIPVEQGEAASQDDVGGAEGNTDDPGDVESTEGDDPR